MENGRQLAGRRPLVHFVTLLFVAGCGSSLMGGTGGSGGGTGTGGASGTGGAVGSGGVGGASACPQSTYPTARTCCEAVATHDPLTEPYVCNENTGTWVCPGTESTTGCIISETGSGGASGGSVGSGGGDGGGGAGGGGGVGGNPGSGGGGGASACASSTKPSGVCCLALVTHDPVGDPYVCDESSGTWMCPSGHIAEPSLSACLVEGAGGATGGNVDAGGGGIGGAGGLSGHL